MKNTTTNTNRNLNSFFELDSKYLACQSHVLTSVLNENASIEYHVCASVNHATKKGPFYFITSG